MKIGYKFVNALYLLYSIIHSPLHDLVISQRPHAHVAMLCLCSAVLCCAEQPAMFRPRATLPTPDNGSIIYPLDRASLIISKFSLHPRRWL